MIANIKIQLVTFNKYRNLLKKLVIRDIKVRYRKSFLGLTWTVLNPLLMMLILNLVFSQLFENDIKNFPVYVMIGNIVFNFNSEATTQALASMLGNASLIKKVYIPKYLFPLSKVLSCMVNLGFSLIALILVMIFTKAEFYLTLIAIIIPLIYLLMFTIGLSLILASVNVYFRDIGHLYSVLITAWMYLTPLFYSINIIPANIRKIILWNPMYHFVTYFRMLIMYGKMPNIEQNITCALIGICTLIIGTLIFKKLQNRFILYI
ncbi:ABC transporter permease [Anaerocolumna sp. MB42-C2]|uniref:ABC transporter permease n=1 Tax=Anaerocolumna sp. MB42-C2 TaxID=3070997 RepID=UPI0027DF7D74|nr:ABC transporter permease [Anaerocolumna sp. MB42-C2]WMJ89808.1 ABC transporter permease [Anaerocolumna sp. MB42-C2]